MKIRVFLIALLAVVSLGHAEAPPEVRLVRPGVGLEKSHEPLKYQVKVGARQVVRMVVTIELQQAGKTAKMRFPKSKALLYSRVTEVSDSGDMSYVIAAGTDAAAAPPLKPKADDAPQVTGIISPQGVHSNVSSDSSPHTFSERSQLRSSLQLAVEELPLLLPKSRVGLQGQWHIKRTVNRDGFPVDQVTKVTLIESKAGVIKVRFEVEQSVPPQTMQLPGTPAGETVKINRYQGVATGTMTIALDSLLPIAMESTQVLDMDIDSASMPVKAKMTTELKLTQLRPEP
jgi:hypothetical protein